MSTYHIAPITVQALRALAHHHSHGLLYVPIKEVSERVAVDRDTDAVSMRGPVGAILTLMHEQGLLTYENSASRGSSYRLKDGVVAPVHTMPACNFCQNGTPAVADFKTNRGPWAFGCIEHFNEHNAFGLGLGKGQILKVDERVRV